MPSLIGVFVDPGLFLPVALAVYLLRGQPVWQRVVVSMIVATVAAAALFALVYSSRAAMGAPPNLGLIVFYAIGGAIWSLVFIGIGKLWRRT